MSDALDRLKRKARPKVQPRSTQVSPPTDIPNSRHLDPQTSPYPAALPAPIHPDPPGAAISDSRHQDIQTAKLQDIEVKRSTFRLEAGLIARLHRQAQDHGLSREVLVEAMYEYVEAHPEVLEQVLHQAALKNEHRQQLANRKRAQAMIEKFG